MFLKEEVDKAVEKLKEGKVILYPSDTIWGIGCDAENEKVIKRIYEIKKRAESKSLIILVHDEKLLNKYVKHVPEKAWDLIHSSEKPLTIIYDEALNLPKNLIAPDGSIGIRVVKQKGFCLDMLNLFGKGVVSTSANISGESFSGLYKDINPALLNDVDYVVNLQRENQLKSKSSTIIKFRQDGSFEFIRK